LAFKRGLIRERTSAGREAAKIERLLALNQRRCKRDDIRKIHEPLKVDIADQNNASRPNERKAADDG
jgi:hypothetical protein